VVIGEAPAELLAVSSSSTSAHATTTKEHAARTAHRLAWTTLAAAG